jgi:chromate transporter
MTNRSRVGAVSTTALVRLALFYGVAGFGGGYSVLAQLRRELVEERRWVEDEEFLVLAELSKSLPGTPATTLLALLGQRVGGLRGGIVSAAAFLAPSMALMVACAAAYPLMRHVPGLASFFDGMSAAMVGVVAATTIELGRSALRSRLDVVGAIACAVVLSLRVVSEPAVAAAAVAFGVVRVASKLDRTAPVAEQAPKSERLHAASPWFVLLFGLGAGALVGLVRVFVPIGVLTFGGGLAMVPAIEHTVVLEQKWLDPKTFADAVALGQVTPGPIAICATFIGYRVGGVLGSLIATVAMFGPAVGVALAVGHSVERFRRSPFVQGALRALAPAVIGMLAAATISLGRAGLEAWGAWAIALVSFAVLTRFRISPLWPLLIGGLLQTAGTMVMGKFP